MNPNDVYTVRTGDRVRINTSYFSNQARLEGREGTVTGRVNPSRVVVTLDDLGEVSSCNVTQVPVPEPLADWEKELLAAAGPAESSTPDPEVLVDIKRAQAAKLATEILPEYAELDDVLKLADYLQAIPAGVFLAASPAPAIPSQDDLVVRDVDGDTVRLHYRGHDETVPVDVSVNDVHAYLSVAQVDQLIARLEQFKAAVNQDQTPF